MTTFIDPATGDPIITPCMKADGELWYSTDPGDQRAAKMACTVCPAVTQCLQLALKHEAEHGMGYRHGVWGNTLPSERGRMSDRKAVA